MRVGIAHHFGWAIAVTATFDELAAATAGPIESISIRRPPVDFPTVDFTENVAVLDEVLILAGR